ncbi:MAG: nicotinate phosphoribosyltransferase [Ezakiella sp.]|nr:nicotinate phosphoribosyltransferase [Ezakiella sp.]MDD7471421.1 nicotinate phosphoribosyltransferase [Bacillota bacterium]MDY3922918.1 nicotinate phosphoribosyltransferase [Ezakiella sp.]
MENLERNLTLLADFYEFTMANGYIKLGRGDKTGYFDYFFRRVPDDGGYAIFAGLTQLIEYLENLKFNDEDIEYFKSKGIFSDEFLQTMRNFKFTCDVWAVKEGSVIFPHEPIVTVKGPLYQVQMIETMLLLILNHQSLVATKTSRIVRVANGRDVSEFGSRRAHGADAANYGARAAYIGGAVASANAYADRHMGIPATGTMAHSWVQSFDSELEAFRAYAEVYPDSCLLLVDTYDVLRSGVPHAIKVFDELKAKNHKPIGVRIDSGDIAYLTKATRKMLDEAGYEDAVIVVSNSMDEHKIKDLLNQGAKIDAFGVGERLITAKSDPVFGGVYKLVAMENDGEIIPKIKISEDVEKITNPGFKQIYRLYDKETGYMEADLVTLHDEEAPNGEPLEIFHPLFTWKRSVVSNYEAVPLLTQIFKEGKLIYKNPDIEEIRNYAKSELDRVWEEVKRLDSPHAYYVDLSQKLYDVRFNLLKERNDL